MANRQANRVKQRKVLLAILSGVMTVLVYGIFLGNHGIRHYLKLHATLESRSAQAYTSVTRNAALATHLDGLRTDDRVLEEVARSTLGVAGKDEIVFVFRERPDPR